MGVYKFNTKIDSLLSRLSVKNNRLIVIQQLLFNFEINKKIMNESSRNKTVRFNKIHKQTEFCQQIHFSFHVIYCQFKIILAKVFRCCSSVKLCCTPNIKLKEVI